MTPPHEVELNFFYLHWKDAQKLVQWSEEANGKLRSLYARHAILSCVFAVEALTNKILNDFYILPNGSKYYERLHIREKVFSLPFVCGKEHPVGHTFDVSKEPFQSFSELVYIRNWLVHPQNGRFVPANRVDGLIYIAGTDEELPWIETDFGHAWPHTQIPVNPFELTGEHARKAFSLTENFINELRSIFNETVTDRWLDEIVIRSKDGNLKSTSQFKVFGVVIRLKKMIINNISCCCLTRRSS